MVELVRQKCINVLALEIQMFRENYILFDEKRYLFKKSVFSF